MSDDLQRRVDALVSGECSATTFLQELSALCDSSPDSAWDVLSRLDQYHRRGKLSAEQYLAIKERIERHVLGAPGAELTYEYTVPVVPAEAPAAATRGSVASIRQRAPRRKELAEEVRALRMELLATHNKLQRYRKRIATLVEFGRRTRSVLAKAQRELASARGEAIEQRERLSSGEWRRAVRKLAQREFASTAETLARLRRRWPIRATQLTVLTAIVLGVAASQSPRELLRPIVAPTLPPLSLLPIEAPKLEEPGEITLSTDRYVVLPGHGRAEIQVQRTGGASGAVSFRWWTRPSGARPGRDYVAVNPQIVHVPDGVDTLRLSVPILHNPARKHTELFYVAIGKPDGGASLGSIRRATVFIVPP